MDGTIISDAVTLDELNANMSRVFSSIGASCADYNSRIAVMSQRISDCLDEAVKERQLWELKRDEAVRRQNQLADAGGDSALSVVTELASLAMTPEIMALNAAVAKAQLKEDAIRRISDDFHSDIAPLSSRMSELSNETDMLASKSDNYLSRLSELLYQIRHETSGSDRTATNVKLSSSLSPAVNGPRVVVEENSRLAGSSSAQNNINAGVISSGVAAATSMAVAGAASEFTPQSTMMPQLFQSAEPVAGGLEQSSRTLLDGSVLTTTGLAQHLVDGIIKQQGNNSLGYKNDCALATAANWNRALGRHVTEDEVVHVAKATDCCEHSYVGPQVELNGGTGITDFIKLMNEAYSIPSHEEKNTQLNIDQIGNFIESGHLVAAGVNAGTLWGQAPGTEADHMIMITKVVRNSSGKVEAFYVADTGQMSERGNNLLIKAETFSRAFFVNPFTGFPIRNAYLAVSNTPLLKLGGASA